MRRAQALAGAGHGQLVAVMGEAGVGKTRLLYEFLCALRTHGWLLLESQADSYRQATPYHPVRELLTTYFQLETRDDAGQMRARVTAKLRTLDPALESTLPAMLALLDVPGDNSTWQALEPPQRRQWTLDALKRLVLRESQVQPVLLVCENLHWIDTETQAFLESLVDSLPTARLLCLVNYRPEYQHSWGSKTYYTQIRIDPLPPTSAEGLLQVLLGDDRTLEPLKRTLIARTEGNPFFLEESVRTLVESHVLVGELGAYRLAQACVSMQVPPTVHAVLAARMDRLPMEEKTLLQAAAVIGKDVPFPLLQAITELSEEPLRGALAHLQTAEFLYETSLFPELEYTFKHALTQEVAYGSLLQQRRRVLHAHIVKALETLVGERVGEQAERLAHHALRGEVWEKALYYSRLAGAKAEARSAYREAVACFEQALRVLQHLPESRHIMEQAIDLRFTLRNVLLALGEYQPILAYLRQAATLAQRLGDQRRLGWVLAYLTRHFTDIEAYDRTLVAGERALAIARDVGDGNLQIVTQCFLGQAYHFLGDYRQARDVLTRNVVSLTGAQRYERFGLPYPAAVHAGAWLVASLAELGAFAEGFAWSEEVQQIAEAVPQPPSLIHASNCTGVLHLYKGDLPQAITALERSLELSQVGNLRVYRCHATVRLSYAYALSGRVAEAMVLLEQALRLVRGRGWNALGEVNLSEVYLLAGHRVEALQLAERTLADAAELHLRSKQAWALRLLGVIHAQSNPPAVALAEAFYRQALTLAEELGMRPLQARCHRGLGTLYAATGQRERARTALMTAIEMYHAMEMTFWLPQTEAVLAQVEGR
jgi:tetratricopeptide (TPR) repeat protein